VSLLEWRARFRQATPGCRTAIAAGVNINIPVWNGGLFSAQRAEAEERAAAAENDVRDLSIQIAREVRIAWLEASTAARRLDVTSRLLAPGQ
jgi:outer membrane protein